MKKKTFLELGFSLMFLIYGILIRIYGKTCEYSSGALIVLFIMPILYLILFQYKKVYEKSGIFTKRYVTFFFSIFISGFILGNINFLILNDGFILAIVIYLVTIPAILFLIFNEDFFSHRPHN